MQCDAERPSADAQPGERWRAPNARVLPSLQAGLLPSAFPDLELHSTATFGLTSFALSLLLVRRRAGGRSGRLHFGRGGRAWPMGVCACVCVCQNHSPDIHAGDASLIPSFRKPTNHPTTRCAFRRQVFRTNASYSRWLDARKAWGYVLNRSRDLVRQVRSAAAGHAGCCSARLCICL